MNPVEQIPLSAIVRPARHLTKTAPAFCTMLANSGLIICTISWVVKPLETEQTGIGAFGATIVPAQPHLPRVGARRSLHGKRHSCLCLQLATGIFIAPAPVAQRIEHWPPEPGAWVRVPPGVFIQESPAPRAHSEPARLVDDVSQRPALVKPYAVVEKELGPSVVQVRPRGCYMGRDQDAGRCP